MDNKQIECRWMIRRHIPEVLEIEQLCFQFAWREEDFIRCLRSRNCIGTVCKTVTHDTATEQVLGFFIYELCRRHLEILKFAVHPSCWGRGVGTAMVDKLKSKLSHERRSRLYALTRETNVGAQAFFSSKGFRVCETVREAYEETDEDGYLFEYQIPVLSSKEHV